MNFISGKNIVHVEVCVKRSEKRLETLRGVIEPKLKTYLSERKLPLNKQLKIHGEALITDFVDLEPIDSFVLECDGKSCNELITAEDLHNCVIHLYFLNQREMELEMFESENADDCDTESVPSSNHWLMPSNAFYGLWENLIYEDGLKEKLIRFALSALTFSQHKVNQNIVACNRLILLHGPPGTGKTSLCRALTQKLAIRISRRYRHTHLIEINSHSLFSKWFSESGKLVMRLFAKIRDLVAMPQNLVCVLIDEVESLAYARNSMSGMEPKDAMRVVNALLTQLDSIKEYPNVLILATSNLAESIDMAFLDRADIKQHIGLPSFAAIRRIYETMLLELMRSGIVRKEQLDFGNHEGLLNELAERSVGLSGRTLRKLPYLAHAEHTNSDQFNGEEAIWLSDFLDATLAALLQHQKDHNLMRNTKEA